MGKITTRIKRYIVAASIAAAGLMAGILATSSSIDSVLLSGFNKTDSLPKVLNLTADNAVTSSGTFTKKTARNSDVQLTYTSASASSGNHVALASGGTIVNKTVIHSIDTLTATFTGELQARVAYTTSTWGQYFDLVSGQTINLGSNPYYFELKANTGVTLQSASIGFTCNINNDAEPQDSSGQYLIEFQSSSSDSSSTELSNLNNKYKSGSEYVSNVSLTKVFPDETNGLKLGSGSASGSMTLTLNSTSVEYQLTSIDVYAKKYGTDTGTVTVSVNDNAKSVTESPASGGGNITLALSPALTVNSLRIATSSKRAYISAITLHYGTQTEPGAPAADEIGFSAVDGNALTYTTNSTFDTDNDLTVRALKSDGTYTDLSKGGVDGYSYAVKNSNNEVIDTSMKFAAEGEYLLTISYKSYIPVEITLTVGEYIYPVEIVASFNTVTFTTADRLSNNLVGNVSALVTFSNSEQRTIQYNSFADNGIAVKLLTPKGFTYEQSEPFGSEGNWTVKLYFVLDENISYSTKITVNAIPVTLITLSDTTLLMEVEDTHQLTTTINPNNATNDAINWSSNNEEVATVEDGLVTAIGVGKANITASAADGSGIFATCAVTVTAKPNYVIDTLTRATTGISNGSTTYSSWSNKTLTSDAVYAGQSAGGNDAIQLRSNNSNSGIITTTSGGNLCKVVVEWNSNTSGRVLNVYGKNSAYSSPSDLYSNNSGTLIGTIDSDTETELVVSDEYTYVGVRSSSGAMYLDSISFYWGELTPVEPIYPETITAQAGKSIISTGETTQISVDYSPSTTNVKNVTYTSGTPSVATVSSEGVVTGVSVGSSVITVSAEGQNGPVTTTVTITVQAIAVTGISLDQNSITLKAGRTQTLVPTISPSNATNKNITWSTTNSGVASISGGVVTAVAAGTATITATTQDGNKTASCIVTVTAGSVSSTWELVTDASTLTAGDVLVIASSESGVVAGNISSQVMSEVSSTFTSNKLEIEELSDDAVQLTLGGQEGAWTLSNDEGELLGATAVKKLAWGSGTTTWTISISGGDATISSTTESYGRFLHNSSTPRFTTYTSATSSTMTLPQLYRGGTAEPVDPTSVLLNKTSVELSPGGNTTLTPSYVPSNANQNKEITWTSSNTSYATVDSNGKITIPTTATVGKTATITATLTNLPTIKATCTVTIVESKADDHTVMIYLCGSNLESGTDDNGNVPSAAKAAGYATGDIQEMLSVSGQPDDVNVIIETGGANTWKSNNSFSISSTKLERWHIENRSLVKDDSLTYAGMGKTSTFQSFLEWGLQNYPADRIGVVLWNHGGGMRGVCYDEKDGDDNLLNSEISTAVKNAFTNTSRSTSNKLEWIGYDACLMAVQDIAEFNSKYFNWQMSSEESEAGDGWDYDVWMKKLYDKSSTTTILKSIADSFINDNGGTNSNGDQTQSYLNLSYANDYKVAWEALASQLSNKLTNSNKSSFNSAIVNNVKHFADSDYDYFCLFDAKDFINKLTSNSSFNSFKVDSSYTNAVLTAFDNLVAYSAKQRGAGDAYGLCMYWTNSTQYSTLKKYYTTSETNFTNWRSLCSNYGYHD